VEVDPVTFRFHARGVTLAGLAPLIDGAVPPHGPAEIGGDRIIWPLDRGRIVLDIERGTPLRLHLRLEDERSIDSLGLRFTSVTGVGRYLRNGYQSWDGSFFVAPGTPAGDGPPAQAPTLGFATTALLPRNRGGAVVLGYERHDRFQTRFRFGGTAEAMTIDTETLLDRTGAASGETLLLFDGDDVEDSLRRWSRLVADASPMAPRIPARRITGWCSWYSLYTSIDETVLREHLAAAAAFRDSHGVPLEIFQIDDGFTPEMGDWLEFKLQFPNGLKPLLAEIAGAGFTPGLWIAPFMVGNRSRLFAEHPDWVVRERATGAPLAELKFYGEYRWAKRSEEYYILDITHPDAEAYIRQVFRTWRRDWGCGYFKTDFMHFGSEHGPDHAVWHEAGLSRVAIWRRMAALIREEIGDALWLGCGCPLWASVGFVDGIRIGRDSGVAWRGERSAESLFRDQLTRNHASNILWQADPDCVLLRSRFHELDDVQVRSLALFAGLSGGVLMTSDRLDELTEQRASLFAGLLDLPIRECRFSDLGGDGPCIVQQADGIVNLFNPTGVAQPLGDGTMLPAFSSRLSGTTL